jgi:uncharacterized integral membrane protein (TIGR00697 family)
MNEITFFIHVLLIIIFLLFAVRLGKNALVALIAMCGVLANLFVVKQMQLFSLTVTCSDVFAVGCIWGLNLLQEYFGKDIAKKTVHITFFALIFFAVMAKMHLIYIPSVVDGTHDSFVNIFSSTPRIVIASLSVFYLVQRIDVHLFSFLSKKFKKKKLFLRMITSLCITQLLDTILFSFFGLYGIISSMLHVVIVSYMIKVIVIITSAAFGAFAKQFFISKTREINEQI